MPPYAGEAMALGCALAWAVAVLLFRSVGAVDPKALNLFKNVLASALLGGTLLVLGRGLDLERPAEHWLRLIASGVLGLSLADTLFFKGLQRIGASVAAVTDCAYSPTVLVLSVLVLGEAPREGLLIGAPLVVAGLGVVSWPQKDQKIRVDLGGVALAIAGVVTTALGVIIAKPALNDSDLIEATTVRLLAGTVGLLAWGAATGSLRKSLVLFRPQPLWRQAVPAAVMGTYVSMILWLGGIKYTSASRAALLNQMATVFLLILSARVGGERVPGRRWLGAALALTGAVIVLVV